jgi:hypothetical protein
MEQLVSEKRWKLVWEILSQGEGCARALSWIAQNGTENDLQTAIRSRNDGNSAYHDTNPDVVLSFFGKTSVVVRTLRSAVQQQMEK